MNEAYKGISTAIKFLDKWYSKKIDLYEEIGEYLNKTRDILDVDELSELVVRRAKLARDLNKMLERSVNLRFGK